MPAGACHSQGDQSNDRVPVVIDTSEFASFDQVSTNLIMSFEDAELRIIRCCNSSRILFVNAG